MSSPKSHSSASEPGFVLPDWRAPIDVRRYLLGAQQNATVKGMFFTCITQMAREQTSDVPGREHYAGFKGYPLTEWIELLPQCAAAAHPNMPLRRALFETGAHIYRTFRESVVGGVIMSVAGRDVRGAVRLVARAYAAVGSVSTVKLAVDEPNRAVIEMREMWEFPDCYQAGILASAARTYGIEPGVRVRSFSPSACDIELSW